MNGYLAGKLVRNLKGHSGNVNSLAWNPDGTRLASISEDTTLRIWDVGTGTALATARGHFGP
ncbi:MAG TPA: hypothetical protein VN648_09835, partial [Candidatus Methylomirabilis sp.]|nr:hypothetical protein [Candidatus Methylomirabilis sp.]